MLYTQPIWSIFHNSIMQPTMCRSRLNAFGSTPLNPSIPPTKLCSRIEVLDDIVDDANLALSEFFKQILAIRTRRPYMPGYNALAAVCSWLLSHPTTW
jgi:hypothetical protein